MKPFRTYVARGCDSWGKGAIVGIAAVTIIIRHGCCIWDPFERRVNRLSFISKDNRCFSIFLPLSVFLAGFASLLPSVSNRINETPTPVELASIIRINSTMMASGKNRCAHGGLYFCCEALRCVALMRQIAEIARRFWSWIHFAYS